MISDEEIQETFYNEMMNVLFNMSGGCNPAYINDSISNANGNKKNFVKELVILTFHSVLGLTRTLKNSNGVDVHIVVSSRGTQIHVNNISQKYQQLFINLIHAKTNKLTNTMLPEIANSVMELESFKTIIDNVLKFYVDSMVPSKQKRVVAPVGPVNIDSIRETFYNVMVEQYCTNNSVTKEDIIAFESHIFIALSAYAIFAVATTDKTLDGIRLCNGGILTSANCPAEFKQLLQTALQMKQKLNNINLTKDEENYMLNAISLQNSTSTTVRKEVSDVMAQISGIAIHISQLSHFKLIIGQVLKFLLDISS